MVFEKTGHLVWIFFMAITLSAISLNPLQYGTHGLWLGDACPAIAFGLLDRIIMCHIGQKLEYFKNRHIQEFWIHHLLFRESIPFTEH